MDNGRATLNEYLEKPLELDSGVLSTQVNMSVTSLSAGGVTGRFVIKDIGSLVVVDRSGVEVVTINKTGITINDGVNDRVKLGNIS